MDKNHEDVSGFYAGSKTPPHSSCLQDDHHPASSATTNDGGLTQLDFLETSTAIEPRLLANKFLFYVSTTLLFYAAFTVVAYAGISVETVYEAIGTSKKAEARLEIYNTYSSYIMAFIETLLAMYTSSFMPALDVYVHNSFYFLQKATATRDATTGKLRPSVTISRAAHRAILLGVPFVLVLTLGNSVRGFQAGQSSNGFKRVMIADDLKKEQPTLEQIKAAATKKQGNATALVTTQTRQRAQDTILRNAIRGTSKPFSFYTSSPCGASSFDASDLDDAVAAVAEAVVNSAVVARTVQLNVHEVDATSAVYGFVPQEWNSEAIPEALDPKSTYRITYAQVLDAQRTGMPLVLPPDFSISTAYEILVQGKLLVEHARGNAATATYPCYFTDNRTEDDVLNPNATSSNTPRTNPTTIKPLQEPTVRRSVRMSKTLVRSVRMRRRLQETDTTSSRSDGLDEDDEDDEEEIDDRRSEWSRDAAGVRQCEGAVSSLFDMFDFYDPELHTPENLVLDTAFIFNKTLGYLSIAESEITLEKYELTKQIHLEALRVDFPIIRSVNYGLRRQCTVSASSTCDDIYAYRELAESFCGSDGCAFLDGSNSLPLQREVGVVSYVVNCTLDDKNVHYSANFRGYYPNNCTKVPNAALLYGIGSYISGDEYGSNDTVDGTEAPYIRAPRRHLRFTFAKVTWQTEDLATKFNAKCGASKDKDGKSDCSGLWHQLVPSNRFLFAGAEALPTQALAKADFRSPISLVQLNSPTLYVPKLESKVTLEPLTQGNFKSVKWDKTPYKTKAKNGSVVERLAALRGEECSMLVDSYLNQVTENQYVLEQPLQVMYTSFFYYLMQNAAVTELNDTALALNGTTTLIDLNGSTIALSKSAADSNDRLGNVKLKGDLQVRSIRVSIPGSSVQTSLAGCALIFLLMVVVVCVPARRVEHFDEGASMAQQFVAMRSDEAYPDSVHKKTLLFPATSETVAFDELEVERMVLVHETESDKKVFL